MDALGVRAVLRLLPAVDLRCPPPGVLVRPGNHHPRNSGVLDLALAKQGKLSQPPKLPRLTASGQDLPDDVTSYISESAINPVVTNGEPFVVNPQKVQDGRMHIVAIG